MESFKHICERDGARQGCLGRTDALRRADTTPITSRGASSRRGPSDLPPPGLAPAPGGSDLRAPASPVARGRASRGRTCLVSGQTPEARSPPSVASGGPRKGEPRRLGWAAGCSRQSPFSPPSRTPGTAHGRREELDRFPRQSGARSQAAPMGARTGGGPLASSRPRPGSAECLQPSPARPPQCGARGGCGSGGNRQPRRQQRRRSRGHTPPRILPPLLSPLSAVRETIPGGARPPTPGASSGDERALAA